MTVPDAARADEPMATGAARLAGWRRLYLQRGAVSAFGKLADLMTCRLRGRTPCIVYQMGKVGSTTVIDALNDTDRVRAFQAHRLNPESTARIQSRFRAGETYFRDMIFERGLYHWLRRQRKPVKIITILREPFSQTYSAFFQNLQRNTRGKLDVSTSTIDTLRPHFLEWEDLGIATRWIETEFIPVFGRSPYEQPFDPEQGWCVIQAGHFEILILKLELDDEEKALRIADFLNLDRFAMGYQNTAESKSYSGLYHRFRAEVKIPKQIAASWVASRYMQHFYTPEEAAAARRQFAED